MIGKEGIAFIVLALWIIIFTICFLKHNYDELNNAIEGKNYRKDYGGFSFKQYIEDNELIKDTEWLKQKNNGINPQQYKKKIKYTEHLEDSECLVLVRGL